MMNNIIDGDGNFINTGDKNKISNKVKIQKGDISAFRSELEKAKISEPDIAEIIEIVQEEKPDPQTNKIGPKASGWMKKMIGKSIDGSWQIGLGASGELIASLIANYYGI